MPSEPSQRNSPNSRDDSSSIAEVRELATRDLIDDGQARQPPDREGERPLQAGSRECSFVADTGLVAALPLSLSARPKGESGRREGSLTFRVGGPTADAPTGSHLHDLA